MLRAIWHGLTDNKGCLLDSGTSSLCCLFILSFLIFITTVYLFIFYLSFFLSFFLNISLNFLIFLKIVYLFIHSFFLFFFQFSIISKKCRVLPFFSLPLSLFSSLFPKHPSSLETFTLINHLHTRHVLLSSAVISPLLLCLSFTLSFTPFFSFTLSIIISPLSLLSILIFFFLPVCFPNSLLILFFFHPTLFLILFFSLPVSSSLLNTFLSSSLSSLFLMPFLFSPFFSPLLMFFFPLPLSLSS
ncbi:unnamed protein product [Acanthosepion pharaonis]|uniref:Uncharacterized protein n=1 Tax=Acanthosepion pharaonis TaxID=158019 RepID=A0A812EHA6_ACAPH|nr:unnamed protein product [Sepia pharaonis]